MSRDLLDLVRELNTLNDDNLADRVVENNDVQRCLSELQDILEEMPTLTPPNEWVSVEERLPTDERPVLVFVGYADTMTGFITTSSYFCFDENPHWQWDGLVRDEQRTLSWMPLPAPPGRQGREVRDGNAGSPEAGTQGAGMNIKEIIRRAEKELSTATRNLETAKRRSAPEQDVRNLEAKVEYRKAVLEILTNELD